MRTFLAVEIPRRIKEGISDFIEEERKKDLPIKWVEFRNLHITLKFLGEISEDKKKVITPVIKEVTENFQRFQINLEGIGCFPAPKNPRVLWIGVKKGSDRLNDIANGLEEKLAQLGIKKEKRFHAHLTIGRIKKFCQIDEILVKDIKTELFVVNMISFFKSTLTPKGQIYEMIETFKLANSIFQYPAQ